LQNLHVLAIALLRGEEKRKEGGKGERKSKINDLITLSPSGGGVEKKERREKGSLERATRDCSRGGGGKEEGKR